VFQPFIPVAGAPGARPLSSTPSAAHLSQREPFVLCKSHSTCSHYYSHDQQDGAADTHPLAGHGCRSRGCSQPSFPATLCACQNSCRRCCHRGGIERWGLHHRNSTGAWHMCACSSSVCRRRSHAHLQEAHPVRSPCASPPLSLNPALSYIPPLSITALYYSCGAFISLPFIIAGVLYIPLETLDMQSRSTQLTWDGPTYSLALGLAASTRAEARSGCFKAGR
jgi:hypothetical protein